MSPLNCVVSFGGMNIFSCMQSNAMDTGCSCGLFWQVLYGLQSYGYNSVVHGNTSSYVQRYPKHSYVSGTFHHAKLTGLQPNTTYYFR